MALSSDQFGEELSDHERDVLSFEKQNANMRPARKEIEIYNTFGHSATRHFQKVNAIIDKPQALAHDPVTVNRLLAKRQRAREERERYTRESVTKTWVGKGDTR